MAPDNEPQPSPARQRAEARKQKLLSQGNDRLAKITGAMKGHQPAAAQTNQETSENGPDDQDPPEFDISNTTPTTTTTAAASPLKSKPSQSSLRPSAKPSSTNLRSRNSQASSLVESFEPSPFGQTPLGDGGPGSGDDPMLQMMRAMGLELPKGLDTSSPNLFNINPQNQQQQQQVPVEPSLIDRLFPILNLSCIIGLIVSAITWWSFRIDDPDTVVDLKAEWDALQTGSPLLAANTFGPAPVFWWFVTAELMLQASRWIFKRNTPQSPGMLGSLLFSLPPAYSNLLRAGLKYYRILGQLWDDLCVLIFGIGCAVVWFEWNAGANESGLSGLIAPA